MSTETAIQDCIESAADAVGPAWPLHSFVTANPLAGFEDTPFHQAVEAAERLLDGDGYPDAEVFRRAWEAGRIDTAVLETELAANGYDCNPRSALEYMEHTRTESDSETTSTATDHVDAILSKWLGAFLEQGSAEWGMPNREAGFYTAFRDVAHHDSQIPDSVEPAALPDDPVDAIRETLAAYPVDEWRDIFEYQLAALPGWTGFLKQRIEDDNAWQSAYPITLAGYLAARLLLANQFDAPIAPPETAGRAGSDSSSSAPNGDVPLPEVWLTAWEATYRGELVEEIADASEREAETREREAETREREAETREGNRPDAQLVFCIDTRSEIIRRHIEATGDYETHGYAGFFGIPMRYGGYDADVTVDACPPILDAQHHIEERPGDDTSEYDRLHDTLETAKGAVTALKSNAATAFSFVESAGAAYGGALAARTLRPATVYDLLEAVRERAPTLHEVCDLSVDYTPDATHELPAGLTREEKVEYAATAFELMGWEEFARVVVFAGHTSQTANNPFDSSLDCGACAGNPGGPNARVLAAICNDDAVRDALRERGIDIPEETVFLAGEHNTTTDEVELFAGDIPESHADDIAQLRADLETAREGATAERAADMDAHAQSGVREAERRAADWAETRPEWGLAGNAGFVIGSRSLTEGLDLNGRSFLHSYDWQSDPDGEALAAILSGPMVVTQWINTQYYFATVDTGVYGSGSKVTQNPVGNVGVYQGNGGDLLTGLPLQSLMSADGDLYHQPVRLSTVVTAPVERVTEILAEHDELRTLLENNWLSLTVIDPQRDHRALRYEETGTWVPVADRATVNTEAVTVPSVTAD